MARNASAEIRRRPKDRKAQIARAAAEAFSEQGYHGVSMEAIAARVGVSAAALYRPYRPHMRPGTIGDRPRFQPLSNDSPPAFVGRPVLHRPAPWITHSAEEKPS